jgi:hypothetical protein
MLGLKRAIHTSLQKVPIDGGYKTPKVEIVNLSMLTFAGREPRRSSILHPRCLCCEL